MPLHWIAKELNKFYVIYLYFKHEPARMIQLCHLPCITLTQYPSYHEYRVTRWLRVKHTSCWSPCINTFKTSGKTPHSQIVELICHLWRGGEIAQSLESLSIKRAARVRSRLDLLVIERWNSVTVLLTWPHQCRRLVQKRPSMCYYVCVVMHVKDP